MFTGFIDAMIDVGETTVFTRRAGSGPPLLLLHGFPETHLMWHRVAPMLVSDFTVVCADLRGYGGSGRPVSAADHGPYAKRAMALDLVRAMEQLGFAHFDVAGHDRGARVAYRMALDHPDRVERLAVLDIIPSAEAIRRADARLMLSFWPWSLLAQPEPLPERLIVADPDAVITDAATQWGTQPESFPPEIRAAYAYALSDPSSAHAICEEYRAAVTIDVAHDEADQSAGRRIACPTLVLWAEHSALDDWYADAGGPLGIWRAWASDVTGHAVPGGHFFPEERPTETAAELREFFVAR
jgi:haloacetate dehalogenase